VKQSNNEEKNRQIKTYDKRKSTKGRETYSEKTSWIGDRTSERTSLKEWKVSEARLLWNPSKGESVGKSRESQC